MRRFVVEHAFRMQHKRTFSVRHKKRCF